MAVAALQVLGLTEHIAERLDLRRFVPAVGQGCVAIEARRDDRATLDALTAIDDPPTRHAVAVERSYLAALGSGCSLPLGGHVENRQLHVFLASGDGDHDAVVFTETVDLAGDDRDHELARAVAERASRAVGR